MQTDLLNHFLLFYSDYYPAWNKFDEMFSSEGEVIIFFEIENNN